MFTLDDSFERCDIEVSIKSFNHGRILVLVSSTLNLSFHRLLFPFSRSFFSLHQVMNQLICMFPVMEVMQSFSGISGQSLKSNLKRIIVEKYWCFEFLSKLPYLSGLSKNIFVQLMNALAVYSSISSRLYTLKPARV